VSAFSTLEAASDLAAANKRISNILRKASIADIIEVDRNLMVEAAEKTLFDALGAIKTEAAELLANADYTQHLTVLAELKKPINTFFDEVMVMAEDPALKANRLALLSIIRGQFSQVADIGLLSE
jgi:glycyl-tRNA synthetase beta chain